MVFLKRISKFYQGLSFRYKLMISLIVISCFIAAYMGLASYRLSSGIIYNMSRQLSENNINFIHDLLNDYFQSVQDSLTQITRIPAVRAVLERNSVGPDEQEPLAVNLSTAVREVQYLGSANSDVNFNIINFYFKNGFKYSSLPNNQFPYNDYESCIKYFTRKGYITDEIYTPTTWCENMLLKDNLGKEKSYVLGIRMLYDSITLEKSGIIIFAVDETDLYKLYSSFSPNAIIMHNNGKMISGSDKLLLGKDVQDQALREKVLKSSQTTGSISYRQDNKKRLISFKRLAANNAYFIVPFDYYSGLKINELKYFSRASILIAIAGIAAAMFFALLLSKGLSSSVLALKNVVQKVYEGDLDARFVPSNSDEVAYLGEKFNDALDQINNLFKIQEQDARIKRNLELRLMQSQINPHLLYNTLDSVLWALKNDNTPKAQELIVSLSSFFKVTLSGGNMLIPLDSELKMIKSYINIQNTARGKNITLDIQIEDKLKEYRIIKLTLQPMVENAIIHGFSGYRDDGIVTIGAEVNKDIILIWVQDNGIGVLPDELSQINTMLNTYPPVPGQKHFGLYNVNLRIKNIFGDKYGIYMESEVGDFTKTVITIPYQSEERSGDNV